MTLNVTEDRSTEADQAAPGERIPAEHIPTDQGARGERIPGEHVTTGQGAPGDEGAWRAQAGEGAPADTRPGDAPRPIGDELLDELTAWPPRDRAGMFRNWHRGALSLIQLNVVAVLEAEGPLPMSRLADELDVSVASATGIVDRMERRGMVQRRHATDDRRVVDVHLTEQGTGIFRNLEAHRREHLARLLGELTEEELAGFLKGIRAIRAARKRLVGRLEPGAAQDPEPGAAHDPEPGAAHDPEPGAAQDPEPGAAQDPEPGTAHDPDTASDCGPEGGAPGPRTVESRDPDR